MKKIELGSKNKNSIVGRANNNRIGIEKSGPFSMPTFRAVSRYFHKKKYKILLTSSIMKDSQVNSCIMWSKALAF